MSQNATDAAKVHRPDLVLIMTDQQRFDQVGYASCGHFETPALDALAGRGVVFDTAYSASTTCVPARAALLTGLQPHRLPTQENGVALREGFWTVAHELRNAGYETALIGKMHFAPVHARHGFETMRLCEHLAWQGLGPESRALGDTTDDYHDWLLEQGLADYRLENNGPMPADYPAEAHPTAWIEREVSQFLATRDRSKPLFLVISFPHPHAPYDPPSPYDSMYDPADCILPATGFDANDALPFIFQFATSESQTRDEAADPARVRAFLAVAHGLISQLDAAIERLVSRIELDRTAIFFTSDHGDYAGNRGLMRKNPWIPFDDLARVPFFVVGAGVIGGRRVPEPVQSCDFALTCLDFAGITPPAQVEFGTRSLRPILVGDPAASDVDRVIVCGTGEFTGWPMVRRGRYKLIENGNYGQPVLFDLEADPHERNNLHDDPGHRDAQVELERELRRITSEPVLDIAAAVS